MKKYTMNEITLMQYIFLIQGAQVGTGILSLPRTLAEVSGTDGWISLVVAWFLNFLAGYVILLTIRRYQDFTLPDLFNYLFGKWFGKLLLLPLIVYYACYGWMVLINAMLYIKAWFLPKTSEYMIVLLFAIPSYLIVRHGIRVQARYSELVFYMMMWMPLIFLVTLKYGHWIHLLPLFKEGFEPILNALPKTVFAYAGNEILFFIYPFLNKKQYAVHGLFIANTMTMLIYVYITIVCFVFFTPDEITLLNQPALSLLKTIEFRFLERVDMLFLALYLIVVTKTWSAYIYCTVFSTSQMLKKQDHSKHTLVYFIAAIACTYVLNPTWNQSERWTTMLSNASMIVLYVLPVLLLIYTFIFEKYRRWKAA